MKSINAKISVAILTVLVIVMTLFALTLFHIQKGQQQSQAHAQNHTLTEFLIESIAFSMDNGVFDVTPLEEKLGSLESAKSPDPINELVLGDGDERDSEGVSVDGVPHLRITSALPVGESCLSCHPQFAVGAATAAVLLLILTLWFALRQMVVMPVSRLRNLVMDLAEGDGDLTKRLAVTQKDEIGQVAKWIDVFMARVQNIVVNIKDSSVQNSTFSKELTGSVVQSKWASRHIATALEEIIGKIEVSPYASAQSGDAFGQIQASVRTVVDSFSEIADSTNELKNGSTEVLHSSSSLLTITETIRSQSEDIRARADQINLAAQEVTEISGAAKSGIGEIGEEAAGIAAESEWVEEISRRNSENAGTLLREVEIFRTE